VEGVVAKCSKLHWKIDLIKHGIGPLRWTWLPIRVLIPRGAPPHSLKYSNASLKMKTMEGVGVHSLACNILGVEGHVGAPRWGLGRVISA
jgi:hypothetical protein